MEQGRAEGAVRMREMIGAVLRVRFGEVPEALAQQLEAVTDLGRLTVAHLRALTVSRVEDFSL